VFARPESLRSISRTIRNVDANNHGLDIGPCKEIGVGFTRPCIGSVDGRIGSCLVGDSFDGLLGGGASARVDGLEGEIPATKDGGLNKWVGGVSR